ncbi:MAG: heavy metal-responsive transcriptional regulator [Mariprofundaceae bacterium]|nr:heavy metal-responsive transcriptional regulator [Mariprofundaceae bacterium]
MKISELAKHAQVKVDTIRYYEKRQLLPTPKRTHSGYRIYANSDLKRLLFIVQAKGLGFTLEEIRQLLCLQSGKTDCVQVRNIAKRKSAEIALRIERLSQIKYILDALADQCEQQEDDECPILKSLENSNE